MKTELTTKVTGVHALFFLNYADALNDVSEMGLEQNFKRFLVGLIRHTVNN
jgi:hypothetical protein